mmetsp:Transcript_126192/g.315452  ORF Transcript_126192/g.315452 Transcript_126192/m.315452 type:complete len:272 (-) Transcript_126192:162-977(-)
MEELCQAGRGVEDLLRVWARKVLEALQQLALKRLGLHEHAFGLKGRQQLFSRCHKLPGLGLVVRLATLMRPLVQHDCLLVSPHVHEEVCQALRCSRGPRMLRAKGGVQTFQGAVSPQNGAVLVAHLLQQIRHLPAELQRRRVRGPEGLLRIVQSLLKDVLGSLEFFGFVLLRVDAIFHLLGTTHHDHVEVHPRHHGVPPRGPRRRLVRLQVCDRRDAELLSLLQVARLHEPRGPPPHPLHGPVVRRDLFHVRRLVRVRRGLGLGRFPQGVA